MLKYALQFSRNLTNNLVYMILEQAWKALDKALQQQ
jgi:hypothetical protein